MIILDDINKANEIQSDLQRQKTHEWYQGALISRLNNKAKDPIIVVQQRLHDDDMVGFLKRGGGWTELSLSAIAEQDESIQIGDDLWFIREEGDVLHPEREDRATLKSLRLELGETPFSAQYQQSPVPRGGHIVKWSWFQHFERWPRRERIDWIVLSIDPAFTAHDKGDWSAITIWQTKGEDCYLLDVIRVREEFPVLVRNFSGLVDRWQPNLIIVEAVGGGKTLYQELRRRHGGIVHCFTKLDDKVVRMETEALAIEQGHVFVPAEAEWLETFRDEVVTFPMGKHDDQIDSMSQFLRWRRERLRQVLRGPIYY